MKALALMILFLGTLKCEYTSKNSSSVEIPIDYCKKIDTLVNERYYWKTKYLKYTERILKEIEKKSGITGTYNLGFGGMTYCDTFFNNDVRRWAKYFNCSSFKLRSADTIITPMCDTTTFKMDN